MTGQMRNGADPTAAQQGMYDPEAFGGAAVGLIDRMRKLQQQQASYRPSATLAPSPLTNQSGGRANATNDLSSALGAGQFLRGTWLDMLAKYRPDLTGTPDELAALRKDPKLSAEMVEAYAAENAKRLVRAGHEATPGNIYLAHFAGPSGAFKILAADQAASARSVLGEDAVTANPFLDRMTVGDLRSWADRKMRAQPSAPRSQAPAFPDHADPVFGAPAFPDVAPQGPSSNASPASSRPAPDVPQGTDDRSRGLLSNEPMRLWPVQPPIFFPF
ncbi:hypothetical protein [Bradyrhizobium commune]|uniref:Transglycosylase SLT domain-containing protein n=1 Tax=Bradyrhizobium commune TaxID=83627 RepID=A0A7S9H289_9BRAD|nr:hypothetical protein [Bradyrhizobium commune]QPF93781.1 hypothetical protein IC761_11170 [Bradyrhizobium commune]